MIIFEADAEAALTVSENRLGWVVTPGDACELAKTIRFASSDKDIKMKSVQAAAIAVQFSPTVALATYQSVAEALLKEAC